MEAEDPAVDGSSPNAAVGHTQPVEPTGCERLPDPGARSGLAILVSSLACAAVFTTIDAVWAMWAFHFRWLPVAELWQYSAVTFAIYAGIAGATASGGWLVLSCLRRVTRAEDGLARVLAGPGLPFGILTALWLLALSDVSVVPDVVRPGIWLFGAGLFASLALCGMAVGLAVCAIRDILIRHAALRRALYMAAGVVLVAVIIADVGSVLTNALAQSDTDPEWPNILLITVDALRQDSLSCYGGSVNTPHIDNLAREGSRYTNAWAAAPWTRPSCASIHLGVYPTTHGAGEEGAAAPGKQVNLLPTKLTTLAEALRSAGYSTQAFVSNIQIHPSFGFGRGFDNYCMYENIAGRMPWLTLTEAATPGRLIARRALHLAGFEFVNRRARSDELIRDEEKARILTPSGVFFTGQAMRWIKQARRPFFLWLHYMDVHQYWHYEFGPHDSPDRYRGPVGLARLASATTLEGPAEATPWTWEPSPAAELDGGPESEHDAEPARMDSATVLEDFTRRYERNVAFLDAQIGCITSELEAMGLWDQTLLVLTSDHGEEFGDHGGAWHGHTQYEELTKVPLIMRGPAIDGSGGPRREPCSLIDVAPTLVKLAGVPLPRSFTGTPLLPAQPDEAGPTRVVYSEFTDSVENARKAIRLAMMKCITPTAKHKVELYDLKADPREQENLADELPYRASELLAELRLWESGQQTAAARVRGGRKGRVTMDSEMTEMFKVMGYVQR